MSVAYMTEQDTWDSLLRIWRELDVPEGWRPELTAEGIVVTPPPGGAHNNVIDLVDGALRTVLPPGCGVYMSQSVGTAAASSIFIPDVAVIPRSLLPANSDPVPCDKVLLVAEVTSPSNANHDRNRKRWAYAHGGVPLYLLIDRFDDEGPTVSLFSEPRNGSYHRILRVPFGEPIEIGPPFDLTLETVDF